MSEVYDNKKHGREAVLDAAKECVSVTRCLDYDHGDSEYDGMENNFATIAALWNTYLNCNDVDILPHDVAAMMALLKIVRLKNNPTHQDSWVDLAGYAACGGEVANRWRLWGIAGRPNAGK